MLPQNCTRFEDNSFSFLHIHREQAYPSLQERRRSVNAHYTYYPPLSALILQMRTSLGRFEKWSLRSAVSSPLLLLCLRAK